MAILKKVFLFLILPLMGLGAVAGGVVYSQVQQFLTSAPSSQHTARIVTIPKGATVSSIARLLEHEGVLVDARRFSWYVRYLQAANRIKSGEFRFYTDLRPADVLAVLMKGDEVRYKLTFPEGYNMREMSVVISSLPFLDAQTFLTLASDPEVARGYGLQTENLEGYLFPSTYELSKSQEERALIDVMVGQFKRNWTPEFDARARELGLTQNQVVSLASVIEKETGHPDERPMVGSVFHNRLKKGMKLESDPTIIYGLENYDGNIRRADIRRPHRWNTYVIPGLPPTPIANPGEASLRAALFPAHSDYLFFVARGDTTHIFASTFADHQKNVVIYQILRKGGP